MLNDTGIQLRPTDQFFDDEWYLNAEKSECRAIEQKAMVEAKSVTLESKRLET